jgi:integrase
VKILILSGQRRNEVAGMRWSEINGDTWHLPGERTKNHLPHLVPLSAPVLAILAKRRNEQQALGLNVDLVFTSYNPGFKRYEHSATPRPFSGWSKSKSRLDERAMIESWTLHDLRRTMATLMAEKLQITPHIIEAIINHVSGTKAGVAGTYNRALYLDERKKTLNTWADYVLRIIHCDGADFLIGWNPVPSATPVSERNRWVG